MKSQVADRSVSVPMTLNDLESREERGQLFPADLKNTNKIKKNTLLPFDLHRATKYGTVKRGEGRVSRGSATPPIPRDETSAFPKTVETPTYTLIPFALQRSYPVW